MIRTVRPFASTAVAALLAALAGCGNDTDFGGSSGSRGGDDATPDTPTAEEEEPGPGGTEDPGAKEPPPDGEDPSTPAPFASLTWYWQCDAAPAAAPAATDKDAVVVGTGPHQFLPDELKGTPVVFSGHLCEPAALPRDVIFVVDVSGSMEIDGNDPRVGDTCGRLQAIESVMASIPVGQAKFGVVTFSSLVGRTSTGLFDSKDALYADLAPGGNIADVVCASDGGTNYDAGFYYGGELLRTGRLGAAKEIYFISDGAPNSGQDGVTIATGLKTTGVNVGAEFIPVTIATVMVKGDDTKMKQVASTTSSGQLLHAYVAQSGSLAEVLSELAKNEIVGGELKYRAIGEEDWTTLDVYDHLQGFDFALPSFTIEVDNAPAGLEVLFEYWDLRDNRFATGGKLLWKEGAGD
jgi:hypothetical protein